MIVPSSLQHGISLLKPVHNTRQETFTGENVFVPLIKEGLTKGKQRSLTCRKHIDIMVYKTSFIRNGLTGVINMAVRPI